MLEEECGCLGIGEDDGEDFFCDNIEGEEEDEGEEWEEESEDERKGEDRNIEAPGATKESRSTTDDEELGRKNEGLFERIERERKELEEQLKKKREEREEKSGKGSRWNRKEATGSIQPETPKDEEKGKKRKKIEESYEKHRVSNRDIP